MEKICNKCNELKPITEFYKAGSYKGTPYYAAMCKNCDAIRKASSEYKAKEKTYRRTEEYKEARREYRKLPHVREKENLYDRKYYANTFNRCKKNLRGRLRSAILVKRWFKTTKFYDYIGCNQEQLKQHLESKFTEGMSWENYGKWEIDHIMPLSSAITLEDMYKLCHYTNLQPLWGKDNIAKSNKIPK